jgi:cytochrome o ubiquinol oxidase operon protein cyoD
MSSEPSFDEVKKEWHGTLGAYVVGLLLSLLLTACSFGAVAAGLVDRQSAPYLLIGLAVLQAIVQLRCFLHVGQEGDPRWELLVFYFMVMVLLIIAGGSLWIMKDLDQRVMDNMPMEMTHD